MNNNKKISDELLKAAAQSNTDPSLDYHNASALTIKRAHKRLRILGILTITFWLLAAVVLIIFVHIFFTFFFPRFVEAHNLVQPETIGSEIVQILSPLPSHSS